MSEQQQQQQPSEPAPAAQHVKIRVDPASLEAVERDLDSQLQIVEHLTSLEWCRKKFVEMKTTCLHGSSIAVQRLHVFGAIVCFLGFAIMAAGPSGGMRRCYSLFALWQRVVIHAVVVGLQWRFSDLALVALCAFEAAALGDVRSIQGAGVAIYSLLVIPEVYIPRALSMVPSTENPIRRPVVFALAGVFQLGAVIYAMMIVQSEQLLLYVWVPCFALFVAWRAFMRVVSSVRDRTVETTTTPTTAAAETGPTEDEAAANMSENYALIDDNRAELVVAETAQDDDAQQQQHQQQQSRHQNTEQSQPHQQEQKQCEQSRPCNRVDGAVLATLSRIKEKRAALEARLAESNPVLHSLLRRFSQDAPILLILVGLITASLAFNVIETRPLVQVERYPRRTVPPAPYSAASDDAPDTNYYNSNNFLSGNSRNRPSSVYLPPVSSSTAMRSNRPYSSTWYNGNDPDSRGRRRRLVPDGYNRQQQPMYIDQYLPPDSKYWTSKGDRVTVEWSTPFANSRYWIKRTTTRRWKSFASKGTLTAFLLFFFELALAELTKRRWLGTTPRARRVMCLVVAFLLVLPRPWWGYAAGMFIAASVPFQILCEKEEQQRLQQQQQIDTEGRSEGEGQKHDDDRNDNSSTSNETGGSGALLRERAATDIICAVVLLAFAIHHIPDRKFDFVYFLTVFWLAGCAFLVFQAFNAAQRY